ncbi:hypothetical protein [Limnoglobus roseus]|nr:hypothetical protein [Limnoglobus roseus]
MNTVLNTWGWTIAYQGSYGDKVSIADMFANATGDYVMLAAARTGTMANPTMTFDVLAAALKTDVLTYTAFNQTTSTNGTNFYYNGSAMGFALGGDPINQGSLTQGTADVGVSHGEQRLSWNTSVAGGAYEPMGYTQSPNFVMPGYRSGNNAGSTDAFYSSFTRYVLTANAGPVAPSAITAPAPAGLALGIIGIGSLLGCGGFRRRKAAPAA